MTARIIDGKAFGAKLRGNIAGEVAQLKQAHGLIPAIAVVLVGANPASEVYVRTKSKAVAEAGMRAIDRKLPET
ncbi:MAG TPA: tetrahydrofolate dehydrogenase/cyclohydrolase catalytic domain-containing protein, partial [Pseudolabrys sp.]|nr:tetrahydrofolate dehydrogenase/cyclohydrolase catalytic domain-containing protein [Pseudolabrys sp.]